MNSSSKWSRKLMNQIIKLKLKTYNQEEIHNKVLQRTFRIKIKTEAIVIVLLVSQMKKVKKKKILELSEEQVKLKDNKQGCLTPEMEYLKLAGLNNSLEVLGTEWFLSAGLSLFLHLLDGCFTQQTKQLNWNQLNQEKNSYLMIIRFKLLLKQVKINSQLEEMQHLKYIFSLVLMALTKVK